VEEVKYSPILDGSKESKGKAPQGEIAAIEENPLSIEVTSKTKTPMEKLIYATLLELEKSKVDIIKWNRMAEDNNGKHK